VAVAQARPAEAGVQSVHRALDVLEALAAAGGTASLGELAATCGLPAPTLHRIAGTLADRGYLRHTVDRRYSLGSRLVPLGADAHALLGERALPVLRRLAELTGETANLAVLSQGRAEYVAQAPGRHTMRTFTEVGNRVELHCTGVGKALLAAAGPAQASRQRPARGDRADPRPRPRPRRGRDGSRRPVCRRRPARHRPDGRLSLGTGRADD
jgi:IclR family acetate operon transcriptional repressor